MNHFRTIVSPLDSPIKMGVSDKILTIGSCFANVMGTRLVTNKIETRNNPFGTIYNPTAIHKAITYAIASKQPAPDTYVQQGELHLNSDFHSDFAALSKQELEEKLTLAINDTGKFLLRTKWLVITYGTAWVYVRKDNGDTVANCHKVPQTSFSKELLTSGAIVESFEIIYNALKAINPNLQIIMTVSPVRHVKDTLVLNSISKSVLRSACHEVEQKFNNVSYFPAFEIMMDDLRDYRFYKSDLIHPSDLAEDYIWDKFIKAYGDEKLSAFLVKWQDIMNALNHKPFHPSTSAHRLFLQETLKKLESLSLVVNVDAEVDQVKKQLASTTTDV